MTDNDTERDPWPDKPEEIAEQGWKVGDPPEEGREGDQQDSGFQESGGRVP